MLKLKMGMVGEGVLITSQISAGKKTGSACEDTQTALCGAVSAHAEAKWSPEPAEAHALIAAVDGRSEAERKAKLRLELDAESTVLHGAEDATSEARCAFDAARLEWKLARYQLRALEVGVHAGHLKAA